MITTSFIVAVVGALAYIVLEGNKYVWLHRIGKLGKWAFVVGCAAYLLGH